MPRFALLRHDHPVLHWDLLLEHGSACRTWRLASPPGEVVDIAAEPLSDHRLTYLDYEGPVSGNRGTVVRWDAGRFVWITARDDCVAVLLRGGRWTGRLELIRTGDGWHAVTTPKNANGPVTPARLRNP